MKKLIILLIVTCCLINCDGSAISTLLKVTARGVQKIFKKPVFSEDFGRCVFWGGRAYWSHWNRKKKDNDLQRKQQEHRLPSKLRLEAVPKAKFSDLPLLLQQSGMPPKLPKTFPKRIVCPTPQR